LGVFLDGRLVLLRPSEERWQREATLLLGRRPIKDGRATRHHLAEVFFPLALALVLFSDAHGGPTVHALVFETALESPQAARGANEPLTHVSNIKNNDWGKAFQWASWMADLWFNRNFPPHFSFSKI